MSCRSIQLLILIFAINLCLAVAFAPTAFCQDDEGRWLRVLTNEDSIIDVDRFSLELERAQVIRADFRTTFSKSIPPVGTPGNSHAARLDSIQFRVSDRRYRVRESKFFDASGHVVSSSSTPGTDVWNLAFGRTGSALFSAATQLRPFGSWKVVSYRYASGGGPSVDEPPELKALLGSGMYLAFDKVQMAGLTCRSPVLEPTVMKDEEFSTQVGTSLRSIGMADKADVIYLHCKASYSDLTSEQRPTLKRRQTGVPGSTNSSNQLHRSDYQPNVADYALNKFPATTLILRRSDDKILVLWDGVFVELERAMNVFLPRSYQ
jgi:hypothetical protein